MIEFNLLPDVKLEYIKAQSQKRVVRLVAIVVSLTALFILVITFFVSGIVQKQQISNNKKDIAKYTKQLKSTKDVDKILTVQNQLKSLVGLHQKKAASSRLFGYLSQVTPIQAHLSRLALDFSNSTLDFTGTADSLLTANKFADTLKYATYKPVDDKNADAKKAFNNVVLQSFSRDDKQAGYTISVQFDPALFDSQHAVALTIPNQYTTRSITEEPIFNGDATTSQKPTGSNN